MEGRRYDYKNIGRQNAERGRLALFFKRLGYRFSKINMFNVSVVCSMTLIMIPGLKDLYFRLTLDPISYEIQRKEKEAITRNMAKYGEGVRIPFYGKIDLLDPAETARLKELDAMSQNEMQELLGDDH